VVKAIVFNLLEQVVVDEFGEKTWDALLESAQLEGAYTAVGSYADEDLLKLVSAASAALSKSADEIVRWFGRAAIPLLFQRYPHFFKGHASTKSFVLTLNEVIHPEVRKLFPGADVPEFDFETNGENRVTLGYFSNRKLCSFAEGLIDGAAAHFGETVTIEQTECMKRGDPKCVLLCSFSKA
jgi:predicted hydrocarbon binding protein